MQEIADAYGEGKPKARESVWTAPAKAVDSSVVHTIAVDAHGNLNVDIDAMLWLARRLSTEDFGRLSVQMARAAGAKRPSELQRLLLAIVSYADAEVAP